MPRGDGTGPQGAGPMTGRGAGRCVGFASPGFANRDVGPGFWGRLSGRGGGRGRKNGFFATGLPGWMRFGWGADGAVNTEREALQSQADMLQRQLDAVKSRLNELRSGTETDKA